MAAATTVWRRQRHDCLLVCAAFTPLQPTLQPPKDASTLCRRKNCGASVFREPRSVSEALYLSYLHRGVFLGRGSTLLQRNTTQLAALWGCTPRPLQDFSISHLVSTSKLSAH